jgi:pyruvate carboxylase subunit B
VIVRRHRTPGRYTILVDGFKFEVEAVDERTRAIRQLAGAAAKPPGPSLLAAPMPGLVVRVLVESGAAVQPGQPLVVIEAMKMENELRAPSAGIVRTVHVGPGTAVEKGAPLVEVEALP